MEELDMQGLLKAIGNRARQLRLEKDLPQKGMTGNLKLYGPDISNFEHGNVNWCLRKFFNFCREHKFRPGDFLESPEIIAYFPYPDLNLRSKSKLEE
jgi:hypothetical protein